MLLRSFTHITAILAVLLSAYAFSETVWAAPIIELTMENKANSFGQIIIVKGVQVEVQFVIDDPLLESHKKDEIRLIRVDDGAVAAKKKRGNLMSDTVNLVTKGRDGLGEFQVEYLSKNTGEIWGVATSSVFIVADQATIDLVNRVSDIEANSITTETDPTVNSLGKATLSCVSGEIPVLHNDTWGCTAVPTGPQGPAGADGAQGPQGSAGIDGANGPQGPVGIASNVFAGVIDLLDPASSSLPTGWLIAKSSDGKFILTHNLNTASVSFTSMMHAPSVSTDVITINTVDLNSITLTHSDNFGTVITDPDSNLSLRFILVIGGFVPSMPEPDSEPLIFQYTGNIQSFIVPAGVTSITAKLWGGGGGSGSGSGSGVSTFTGGVGGFSQGDIGVTPGEELFVYVAGGGQSTSNIRGAAGGGGGSSIRRASTRLIVAGGGGGGGSGQSVGGSGGGLSGANGHDITGCGGSGEGGNGGTQTEPGAGGVGTRRTGDSGVGPDGGQLATGSFHAAGGWGDGLGGAGAFNSGDAGSGGGGGGYFGGGEGGGFCAGASGGGGSGFIDGPGVFNAITETGQDSTPAKQDDPDYIPGIAESDGGNGLVVIQLN